MRKGMNPDLYREEWQWQEGDVTVTRSCQWSGPGCHQGCNVLDGAGRPRLLERGHTGPSVTGGVLTDAATVQWAAGKLGAQVIYDEDKALPVAAGGRDLCVAAANRFEMNRTCGKHAACSFANVPVEPFWFFSQIEAN